MRYLLDTCVISEPTKKRPSGKVLTWLDVQEEMSLFLSVLTIGELQKGISKLPRSRRRSQLQQWVAQDLPRRGGAQPSLMPQYHLKFPRALLLLAGVQETIPARAGVGPRVLRPFIRAPGRLAPGPVYGVLFGVVAHT